MVLGSPQGEGKEDALQVLLNKTKEPAGPNTLFVSDNDQRVSDCMTILGLMPIPQIHQYPYMDSEAATLKVVVQARTSLEDSYIRIPAEVKASLVKCGVRDFDFFFVVSDISKLVTGARPQESLNVIYHAWCYPNVVPGEWCGYNTAWNIGAFSFSGSGVSPEPFVDIAFQCLSRTVVHVHPQAGVGMCCSPNNGRVLITPAGADSGISWFWSVAVENLKPTAAGVMPGFPRACVTLHWALFRHLIGFDAVVDAATNVEALLAGTSRLLGETPCLSAAWFAFGNSKIVSLGKPETDPMPSQRRDRERRPRKGIAKALDVLEMEFFQKNKKKVVAAFIMAILVIGAIVFVLLLVVLKRDTGQGL